MADSNDKDSKEKGSETPKKVNNNNNSNSKKVGFNHTSQGSNNQKRQPRKTKTRRRTAKRQTNALLPNRVPRQIAGKYRVGDQVGKGAFGSVYKSLDIDNGSTVAIKAIPVQNIGSQKLQIIMQEVELLKALDNHPNIVKYIDSITEKGFLLIVLEFVDNRSLQHHLQSFDGHLPEKLVALYIFQILLGLKYLHFEGIIHRDIKAANVLIANDGSVKLTDFGVAIKHDDNKNKNKDDGDDDGNNNNNYESVAGSPYWMAPEIIEMSNSLTTACDIWSVGATAIELFTGKPPYYNFQPMAALFKIVQDPHPPYPAKISQPFEQFLTKCFNKESAHRPTAEQLITKTRWFRIQITSAQIEDLIPANDTLKNKPQPQPANGKKKQKQRKMTTAQRIHRIGIHQLMLTTTTMVMMVVISFLDQNLKS